MDTLTNREHLKFGRFAWALLAYNIPVILWGAYVRVSFSGDGCGAHWPFCNGVVVPHHMAPAMAIEFTHRAMTSLDVVAAIALCVWAFLLFPRKHAVRLYSVLSLIFLFIEALLGAGLVLLRLVAKDQSAGRVWYLSAHLTNTMLLLAALTATAWLASNPAARPRPQNIPGALVGALGVAIFVSITGAIAALGDTLFPASSLRVGVQQDFAITSSRLLRLRIVHPALAILGAIYLIWSAVHVSKRLGAPSVRTAARWLIAVIILQLIAGAVNVSLLAPVWLQLCHLFVADILWIFLVVLVLASEAIIDMKAETLAAQEQAAYSQ